MPEVTTTALLLLRRVDCVDGVAAYLESLSTGLRTVGQRAVVVSGPISMDNSTALRWAGIRKGAAEWLAMENFSARIPRPDQVRRVLDLIKRQGVTVIVPQGFAMLPYARLLAALTGLPIVAHYHPSAVGGSIEAVSGSLSRRQRLAYRTVTRAFGARRYIAASSEIRDFFRNECAIPARRIHLQPFGVDEDAFRPPTDAERAEARAELGLSPEQLVCVLPGRLNLVKGHDIAVDAIRRVRERRPDLKVACLFLGEGDQRAEIEGQALRSEADKAAFRFLGFSASPYSVRKVYWAADIMLLPSRHEGFAIVVPEAMACGVVPIRTPAGGARDQIVDGENGFLAPFNDAAAFADRIERLSSTSLRTAMAQRAMATARAKFGRKAMVAGTADLFRKVSATRSYR